MRSFFSRSNSGGVPPPGGALTPPMSPVQKAPQSAFDFGRPPTKSPHRGGGGGRSPGSRSSPMKRQRPRLDNAFKDELRQSVHQIVVQKQKKKNTFNFFNRFKQKSSSDVGSETSSSKNLPRKRLTSKPSPESSNKKDDGRPLTNTPNRSQGLMRNRPTLRKDVAEELKMSFTNRNAKKEKENIITSQNKNRPNQKRGQIMADLPEEDESESDSDGSFYSESASDSSSSDDSRQPTSRQQAQSRNVQRDKPVSRNKRSPPAPSRPRLGLRADVADELRQSVHNRNAKKAEKRAQIEQRVRERRSQRDGRDSHDVGDTYQKPLNDYREPDRKRDSRDTKTNRRRLDPKLQSELRESVHSRSEKKDKRRREIAARIMKRRESERMLGEPKGAMKSSSSKGSSHHSVSFDLSIHSGGSSKSFEDDAESANDRYGKKGPSAQRSNRNKPIKGSLHSTGTFTADFSDDPRDDTKRSPDRGRQSSPPALIHTTQPEYADIEGDFDEYKRDWSRLIKEKKKLKESASKYKVEISDLTSKLDNYKSEKDRLQDQLFDAHEKVERLSAQQTEERKQFDNSTDIIAVTRMDLAKALNDARILKAKISEYESALAQKDRRVDSLNDAIDTQEERIDEFLVKLKRAEDEVLQQTEEKLLLEEELGVLEDLKEGTKFNETITKIKRERSKWIGDQEKELALKRKTLSDDNNRAREKERAKHRRETEETRNLTEKMRAREEELEEMQVEIDRQLKGFREENRFLKEKLNRERLDSAVELKKKEHSVALLQQEISKLKKEAAAHHSENLEINKIKVAADSAKDDLKDALKHKKIMEKEMKRLKREMDQLKTVANDWQEVVVPGHRNLRGVTFGNSNSDSLAGFLTILVEEQYKSRGKKSRRKKSRKLSNFLKDRAKKKRRKKKKKKVKDNDEKSKKKSKKKKKRKSKKNPSDIQSHSRKSSVTQSSETTLDRTEDEDSDKAAKKVKKKKDKKAKKDKKKKKKKSKKYSKGSKGSKAKKGKRSDKSDKKKQSKNKSRDSSNTPPLTIRVKRKKRSKS